MNKPISVATEAAAWSNGLVQRLLHDLRLRLATPSRTPRMAVVLGRLLGIAFILCFATGLYSHFIQEPLPWMRFPTRPIFLYQVSQGIHITAGILCFPLILGKLYVIYPDLFQTPPVRSFAHFFERASIALFVASSLVQITIGLLNTFQWYALFPFPFRQTHWALSFVVIGSLAIHIGVKLPIIARYWRRRDSFDEDGFLRDPDVEEREPEEAELVGAERGAAASAPPPRPARGITGRIYGWIDDTPKPDPRTSRRGFVAAIAAASAVVVLFTAGQSYRALDALNIFAPRKMGIGPNDLPINKTAREAGVTDRATSPSWLLTVANGDTSTTFTRAELERLPQYEVTLPIACVEGWSQYAVWRGPRMRDLADLVGAPEDVVFRATSLEEGSIYGVMEMGPEFVRDELTLVALELNGDALDIDHGFPARMIAPARPGVLQTKWLTRLEVI